MGINIRERDEAIQKSNEPSIHDGGVGQEFEATG
jgi:hypothetical protein